MSLFIVRHAHAVSAEKDSERPLSKRGRRQVRALARFLTSADALQTNEIWHSPLARSRETAALLQKRLGLDAKLVETSGLKGTDDPAVIAARLEKRVRPLAIVGHEPQLSALLSLLVTGAAQPPRFVLKKGAAVALDKLDDEWAVRWQVSPELLDATD